MTDVKSPALKLALSIMTLGFACHAQQPLLQITSPANGTLVTVPVSTGQTTITIVVSADPSVQNVWVLAEYPLPFPQPTSTPNQFSVTIPNTITPGQYSFTAIGSGATGSVDSDPVTIDVERQDDPVEFEATPYLLHFETIGDNLSLSVTGKFADGSVLFMTKSSRVAYLPQDTTVVTVNSTGLVTAVAPGKTVILVQAISLGPTHIYFPVQVEVPGPTLSQLLPSTGPPGTMVTISGTNLGSPQGASTVSFGGIPLTPINWNATTIMVPVPTGIGTGVSNVVVSVNGTTPTNALPFTVTAGTAGPDFLLSASPQFAKVSTGGNAALTISTSALQGFADSVTLSIQGLPPGVSATFNPTSITGAGTSTLTVSSTTAASQKARFAVTATDSALGLTHSVPVTLIVNGPPDFRFSASPAAQTTPPGFTASYTVTSEGVSGFTDNVGLNVTGLPAGATAKFSPTTISGGSGSSTLTVATASSTPDANSTLTVTATGSSTGLTHKTAITLSVVQPHPDRAPGLPAYPRQ